MRASTNDIFHRQPFAWIMQDAQRETPDRPAFPPRNTSVANAATFTASASSRAGKRPLPVGRRRRRQTVAAAGMRLINPL